MTILLCLTRKNGESIYINGQEIKITVVKICGDKVRIGIEAPKEVSVHREKVYELIKKEKLFTHDCSTCEFLGTFNSHDLYVCSGETVIARYGNKGHEYKSCPINQIDKIPKEWEKELHECLIRYSNK